MVKYTPQGRVDAFWNKVVIDETEFACWVYPNKNIHGYAYVWFNAGYTRAHRLAYKLAFGEFPDYLHVCHHCDNRSCVNPNHLFIGTRSDNMRDMETKGRANHPSGEHHVRAKVTKVQVDEIRERFSNGGVSKKKLSKEYGIGRTQIQRIIKGESWSPIIPDESIT